jgi:hypothetical protein
MLSHLDRLPSFRTARSVAECRLKPLDRLVNTLSFKGTYLKTYTLILFMMMTMMMNLIKITIT